MQTTNEISRKYSKLSENCPQKRQEIVRRKRTKMSKKKENKKPWGTASVIMAFISLFLFPPIFALLGILFGCLGLAKEEEKGTAIAGIILSFVFGAIGMILGILFWAVLFASM